MFVSEKTQKLQDYHFIYVSWSHGSKRDPIIILTQVKFKHNVQIKINCNIRREFMHILQLFSGEIQIVLEACYS